MNELLCHQCLTPMGGEVFKPQSSRRPYYRLSCPKCGMKSLSLKIHPHSSSSLKAFVQWSWGEYKTQYKISWLAVLDGFKKDRNGKRLAREAGITW